MEDIMAAKKQNVSKTQEKKQNSPKEETQK